MTAVVSWLLELDNNLLPSFLFFISLFSPSPSLSLLSSSLYLRHTLKTKKNKKTRTGLYGSICLILSMKIYGGMSREKDP